MAKRIYRVLGQVVNSGTRAGIPGLRVELWDKDTKYHDLLGERVTDAEGRFERTFDETYFGDFAPDEMPDLFFRVYQGDVLLKSTEDAVLWNVHEGDTRIVIEIDMPGEKAVRADRVTGDQVMKGVAFLRKSEFRSVLKEAGGRLSTAGTLIADMIREQVSGMEFSPVQAPSFRTKDVIGQDTITAQRNLTSRQVGVTEVRQYQPGLNNDSFRTLTALPVNLREGDRVVLYEQEGRVKSYSIVRETEPMEIKAKDVARLDNEMKAVRAGMSELSLKTEERLRGKGDEGTNQLKTEFQGMEKRLAALEATESEVTVLKREIAQKDTAIAALTGELKSLRSAHESLANRIQPEAVESLKRDVSKILAQQKAGAKPVTKRRRKPGG